MSDEKTMTAKEAWAEVDRLHAELVRVDEESKAARRKQNAACAAWADALDIAGTIGPRPAKVPQ